MRIRGLASFALLIITVATTLTGPAYAGPARSTLKKRYGYTLERKFTLAKYRRLDGGTGKIKGKGRGSACRF